MKSARILILFGVFLFLFKAFVFSQKADQVCFNKHCFKVEVADTPQSRQAGLMGRDQLNSDQGMLFIFEEEGNYGFWMKNTLIPLDIIWLNAQKEVIFIKTSAQPCESSVCSPVYPEQSAKYSLELNAGIVNFIGLEIGDKLDFDINK